jgi:hypothetical protein
VPLRIGLIKKLESLRPLRNQLGLCSNLSVVMDESEFDHKFCEMKKEVDRKSKSSRWQRKHEVRASKPDALRAISTPLGVPLAPSGGISEILGIDAEDN